MAELDAALEHWWSESEVPRVLEIATPPEQRVPGLHAAVSVYPLGCRPVSPVPALHAPTS